MFKQAIETPDYVIPPLPPSDTTNKTIEPSQKSSELQVSGDNQERTIRGIQKDGKPPKSPSSKFFCKVYLDVYIFFRCSVNFSIC